MPSPLRINNLGNQSVNFDLEPCDLPPEVFTFGANYRLVNGKVQAFNISQTLATPPSNFTSGMLMPVLGESGNFYLLMGKTAAYVYNGTTWTNITSAVGYAALGAGDELLWQNCLLGQIPIVNNAQHYPEYWSPQQTTQVLQPLNFKVGSTWQAMGYHAKVIRSHKDYLFALNLSEGATRLATTYRWSHPADTNGLPFTWDELDLSAIAGKASIGGDTGDIVDGLSLRDSFVIYCQRGIHVLDYVGGEFIWRRRLLTNNHGLLAKNCVAEALGVQYFLSAGDIMANDGNSVKSILHRKMKSKLVNSLDATYYLNSFAYTNTIAKEIWFCIPEPGSTLPTLAFIYNYIDDTMSMRKLPGIHTGISYGPVLGTPVTWTTVTGTWASDMAVWSYDPTSQFSKTIVATDRTVSAIYSLELDDGATASNTVLERMSMAVEGQEVAITTQAIYPHIRCTGPVEIQFGAQGSLTAPIRWKPSVSFDPNTKRKVDIRVTGTLISWRIASIGTNRFTLSGMDIEYVTNGAR
jgi:hypothetical protein